MMDNNSNCKMMKSTSKNNIINLDHVYCNTNDSKYTNEKSDNVCNEIKQLQSILILHLDLIQEQSDQLITKDKLLSSLKQENEILKCKVNQLERDLLQLQKKIEEEVKDEQIAKEKEIELNIKIEPELSVSDEEIEAISTQSNVNVNIQQQQEERSKTPPTTLAPPVVNKIVIHRIPNSQTNNITINVNKKIGVGGVGSSDCYKSSIVENEKFIIKPTRVTPTTSSTTTAALKEDFTKYNRSLSGSMTNLEFKNDHFMTTKKPYITCNWKHKVVDETNSEETLKIINLEVPNWREIDFSDAGVGVKVCENTSCETFLKRHAKYEVDEKRRKKWDVQRIREQKNIEKLKKRHFKEQMQDSGGSKNKEEMNSFYPSSEGIKYIHITESVDVAAFGEQIPLLHPTEFTLPWLARKDSGCSSNFNTFSNGQKSKFLQLNSQSQAPMHQEKKKAKHN